MEFGEKIRGMISNPVETFEKLKKEEIAETFKYFAIMAIIPSVLGGIIYYFGISALFSPKYPLIRNPIAVMVLNYIGFWIGLLVGGVWYHLWLIVTGYKGKLTDTYRGLIYGMTPTFLFSWIPVVGFIAGIWTLILWFIGLSKYGRVKWWRPFVAWIISVIIPVLIAVFIGISYIISIL